MIAALLRFLLSFWLSLFFLLLGLRNLATQAEQLPAYAYIINSPDDISARDVQVHDPQTGMSLNILHRPSRFSELAMSPDGQRFAFVENLLGIYTSDILGARPSRVVTGYVGNPLWSPKGDTLLFSDDDSVNLLSLNTLETENLMPLRAGTTWLPDAERIAYSEFNADSGLYEIRIRHLSDESVTSLFSSTELVVYLAFSPDGSLLAYSLLTGQIRLYEIATGREIEIEDEASHFAPQWSADGQYLLFIRNIPRAIDIAIANRSGEIIFTHAPKGLTLESSVLWWPY